MRLPGTIGAILFLSSLAPVPAATPAELLAALMGSLESTEGCSKIFREQVSPLGDADKKALLGLLASEQGNKLVAYQRAYTNATRAILQTRGAGGQGGLVASTREKLAAFSRQDDLTIELLRDKMLPELSTLRKAQLLGPATVGEHYPQLAVARKKMENLLLVASWVLTEVDPSPRPFQDPLADAEFSGAAWGVPVPERAEVLLKANWDQQAKLAKESRHALRYLNLVRGWAGRDPLRFDKRLHAAALWHVDDMIANDYYGNLSKTPGRATPYERAQAEGTTCSAVGLARNLDDPVAVVDGWLTSPFFYRAIFDQGQSRAAVAFKKAHWVVLLGK